MTSISYSSVQPFGLGAPAAAAGRDPFRYLLLLRFALFNLAAFTLFGMAWTQGWIARVVLADQTGLSVAIFAVFTVGLALCAAKVWRVSSELNCLGATPRLRGGRLRRAGSSPDGQDPQGLGARSA